MFLVNFSYSQIKLSYSMGSIGNTFKSNILNTSLIINGSGCFTVTNNITKFWPSKKGDFFSACAVNTNFIKYSIKVAPNPVNTYTVVKFLNKLQLLDLFKLTVFNITGQPLKSVQVSQDQLLNGYRLEMDELPSGILYLHVGSNTISESFKLVKQ
jgi:hypothetical protein